MRALLIDDDEWGRDTEHEEGAPESFVHNSCKTSVFGIFWGYFSVFLVFLSLGAGEGGVRRGEETTEKRPRRRQEK
jgi:hypothetical protein